MKTPKAMDLIVELHEALKVQPCMQFEGCWEIAIDDHWTMAVNGHRNFVISKTGANVPPFSAYLEFNGWPAGIVDPFGGCMAAGSAANEDNLIAALQEAVGLALARAARGDA